MKIQWSPTAAALARRYMRDQEGIRRYRVIYVIDGDIITIERVDRVIGG